jgi:3-oxoacyl-[acyl-carrier protein] reductase
MRLQGKVAVVTGGGTGIGRAVCLRFAQEGCALAVNYSKSQQQAEEVVAAVQRMGVAGAAIRADVSQDREARALMHEAAERLGRLDILVNNAGFSRRIPHRDLEGMTEDLITRILAVNIKGPFYCVRAAVPHMLSNGGGAIVNITSDSAYDADGSSILYCAAKAALGNLTKAWARCLAPAIRVNAVAPGFVDTGFVDWDRAFIEKVGRLNPLGRLATVEDVANAVLFLATDATHVTAETILVNGGVTVLGPRV